MYEAGRGLGAGVSLMVIVSCATGGPGDTLGDGFGPVTAASTSTTAADPTRAIDPTTGGLPSNTNATTRPADPSTSTTGALDSSSGSSGGPLCGDGIVELDEECDRDDLGGLDCGDLDPMYTAGTLACTKRCTFDTSGCSAPPNPIQQCQVANLAIPDDDPLGVSDTITLPLEALGGTITDVNVEVELTHTYIGDLSINVLYEGTSVVLHAGECGTEDNIHAIYDDQAGGPFDCLQSDLGLTVQPLGMLADLDGARVEPSWTLFIEDQAGEDIGTLLEWCVTISWQ